MSDGVIAVAGTAGRPVVVPTVATAVAASLTMIVINFATEAKTNPWWWAAVVGVTGLVALAAVWLDRRNTRTPDPSGEGGGQRVEHARIDGDNLQIGKARDVSIDRGRGPDPVL